jgi:hypothetical protein
LIIGSIDSFPKSYSMILYTIEKSYSTVEGVIVILYISSRNLKASIYKTYFLHNE